MLPLRSVHLLPLIQLFDDQGLNFDDKLSTTMARLIEFGFHSARFYLKTDGNQSKNLDEIQLVHYCYDKSITIRDMIGFKINFQDTTIFKNNDVKKGFSFKDERMSAGADWPKSLGIDGTQWLDILIRNPLTSEIYGLIAVSWIGARALIDEEALASLQILASRISLWLSERSAAISAARERLEAKFEIDNSHGFLSHETIRATTAFFSSEFTSPCASIFEINWITGTAQKVCEQIDGRFITENMFQETYYLGEFLTGKASIYKDFRFIPDFQAFCNNLKININESSLSYHNVKIGMISSCVYGEIAFGTRQYIVRLFRSLKSPSRYFSKKDRDDLWHSCEQLSSQLERRVRQFQQNRIRTAATGGFAVIRKGELDYSGLVEYLKRAGIDNYLLASHGNIDPSSDFHRVSGTFSVYTELEKWKTSHLLKFINQIDPVAELQPFYLQKYASRSENTGNIVDELSELHFSEIIPLTVQLVTGRYFLIIGRSDRSEGQADMRLRRRFQNEEGFLLSLLSVYAAAHEASASLISAERADHMLADMGHEIGTPVSILTQTAILACDMALEAVLDGKNMTEDAVFKVCQELEDLKHQVNETGGLIQIITEIPRALAQIGNNAIEVNFQRISWATLLDEIWKDAMDWSKVLDESGLSVGRISKGDFALKTSGNFNNHFLVCDPAFMRIAIGNLIKNALKYSFARHYNHDNTPRAKEIGIYLEPQEGRFYLNIRNWGVGIPAEQTRKIFGKYYRIDRQDKVRTIRGRGIGLHLARSFIRAHGGDVECQFSKPTFVDSQKAFNLEGFDTQFRLWLPFSNQPGRKIVQL